MRRTQHGSSAALLLRAPAPRGGGRWRRVVAAVALTGFAAAGGGPLPSNAGASPEGPFVVKGVIPVPEGAWNQYVAAVDAAGRRAYAVTLEPGGNRLRTFDLNADVPTLVAERAMDFGDGETISYPSPYVTAVVPNRQRLFMVTASVASVGDSALLTIPTDGGGAMSSKRFAEILPGFFAGGITYSPEDDLLYIVGELSEVGLIAQSTFTAGSKAVNNFGAVVALDPDDGSLVWARLVRECRAPMYTFQIGSLIARSSPALARPSLVFPCTPGGTTLGTTNAGQAGIAVLRIDPASDMAAAQAFDVDFFPIGGNYFNGAQAGIGAYDPGSDRLFMQSLSATTPSAFVLDLRLGAWVGAITSPFTTNYRLGINPATGHFYMGGSGEWILVADGRATPPQNGVFVDDGRGLASNAEVDPVTGRLFYRSSGQNYNGSTIVVEDTTESVPPRSAVDYDRQTDDVAETEDTYIAFTGDADGFGARVTKVGDIGTVTGLLPNKTAPPPTSRALALARVPGTSLQAAGASASAEAAALDTNTRQALKDNPQLPQWPHGTNTCLDGGEGIRSEPETTPTGRAEVSCSLAGFEAKAEARHFAGSAMGATIGEAQFKSRVKRTVKGGMKSEAIALSSGVHVAIPGVGALDIGKVTAEATTTAHGQTKSGLASWKRTIEDVVVTNEEGEAVYRSPGCVTEIVNDGTAVEHNDSPTSCEQLAEAVRQALQVHVRLILPTPDVVATPKGAFASVGQSEAQRLHEVTVSEQGRLFAGDTTTRRAVPAVQLDVYADSTERSRTIVQLATVESGAIFTINRSPDDAPCDMGACIPGGRDGIGADVTTAALDGSVLVGGAAATGPAVAAESPGGSVMPSTAGAPRPRGRIGGSDLAVGMILSRRSLGQGVLMAAFLVLAGAAAANTLRRRRLLHLVGAR